jgi:AraC family transcriptional regulator, chitin signaling transcriptional activator
MKPVRLASFVSLWTLLLLATVLRPAALANDSLNISGIARVIHYTKKDFQGDPQFWTMCQDKDGILYFGNNDGALIFDGQTWQKVRLPNSSSIRSLLVSSKGDVYAGGFNELGTIKKDKYGKYHYESLIHLLRAEDRNIENIWAIHEVQGHLVFRSFKMLIAIANGKAITLPTSGSFELSIRLQDQLFVNDLTDGLKELDLKSLTFTPLFAPKDFDNEELLTVLPGVTPGDIFAITKQGSFFKIDIAQKTATRWQRLLPPNSNNLLTCAIKASTGEYYIGTLRTKLISLSPSGKEINKSQAFSNLQDNAVHNLLESNEGNIWAVLNNGIDCIDVKSPVSMIFEDASIYDAVMFKNKIYMATNQGVFVSASNAPKFNLSKQNFINFIGMEGQAWTLQQFENQVLVSHDKGVFVVNENGFKKVPGLTGIWKIISLRNKPGHYLACGYHGMFLMTYDKQKGFEYKHKLEGFTESSRDILQDDQPGVFWICHGYKGVFKIRIDEV